MNFIVHFWSMGLWKILLTLSFALWMWRWYFERIPRIKGLHNPKYSKRHKIQKWGNGEVTSRDRKATEVLGYKLESVPGIDIVTATTPVTGIGDINRFRNANKLESLQVSRQ
jgi:hypothetical protein